jgi:hypothetical protein
MHAVHCRSAFHRTFWRGNAGTARSPMLQKPSRLKLCAPPSGPPTAFLCRHSSTTQSLCHPSPSSWALMSLQPFLTSAKFRTMRSLASSDQTWTPFSLFAHGRCALLVERLHGDMALGRNQNFLVDRHFIRQRPSLVASSIACAITSCYQPLPAAWPTSHLLWHSDCVEFDGLCASCG